MPKTSQEAAGQSQEAQTTKTTTTESETSPAPPQSQEKAPLALSESEKERIRSITAAAGPRKFGLSRLPTGEFRIDITIPVEIAAALEDQASGAGEPLEPFIQKTVLEALEAFYGSTA